MPLYKVTRDTETRLVKASSAAAALRHVTTPMFTVAAVTDPSDAAEIAASGVKLEVAGELTDTPSPAAPQTPEAAAEHAMLSGLMHSKGDKSPAKVAE